MSDDPELAPAAWCLLGPEARRPHFEALQTALQKPPPAGGRFQACEDEGEFDAALASAMDSAIRSAGGTIRVCQDFADVAARRAEHYPALMLSLKSCDAFDKTGGRWWPRNFLYEGVGRAVALDVRVDDLRTSVFVIGATSASRTAIAALAKIGFSHFNLVDPSDDLSRDVAAGLAKAFFRVKIEATSKGLVTQLPGIHGLVVNGLADAGGAMGPELVHMNFIRPGGAWIELHPGPASTPLLLEAAGAGASVEAGSRVAAHSDAAWAEAALGLRIDVPSHAARLQAPYEGKK